MTTAAASRNSTLTIILALIACAVVIVGAVYLMQDRRTGSERIGDAAEALPNGLDKAADELGDQSPAENVGRNVEKAVN